MASKNDVRAAGAGAATSSSSEPESEPEPDEEDDGPNRSRKKAYFAKSDPGKPVFFAETSRSDVYVGA